jgi:SAM-dependent methyltransferase
MIKKLKNRLKFLINTPIHPQWLIRGAKNGIVSLISQIGEDKVILDVGCFNKWAKQHCPPSCIYIGLDYYETAKNWYGTKPDVYGDALSLPVIPSSIDVVLLIDVLEHVKDTERLFGEIHNILKDNGEVILSFPFLYPLHDEPRDFVRFTAYGFQELVLRKGFAVISCQAIGSPIVTTTFLCNIAATKTVINWVVDKNPAALLLTLLPFIILINNLSAKLISKFEVKDDFMALSYHVKLKKITVN